MGAQGSSEAAGVAKDDVIKTPPSAVAATPEPAASVAPPPPATIVPPADVPAPQATPADPAAAAIATSGTAPSQTPVPRNSVPLAAPTTAAALATASASPVGVSATAPQVAASMASSPKAVEPVIKGAVPAPKAKPLPQKIVEAKVSLAPAAKRKDKQGPKHESVQLSVRNLGKDVTAEQLKAMFAPYGPVSNALVKTGQDGKCRGFGFVTLASSAEANEAIGDLHNKTVDGKQLQVGLSERQQQATAPPKALQPGYLAADGKSKGNSKGTEGKGKIKDAAEVGKGKNKGFGKSKGKNQAALPLAQAHVAPAALATTPSPGAAGQWPTTGASYDQSAAYQAYAQAYQNYTQHMLLAQIQAQAQAQAVQAQAAAAAAAAQSAYAQHAYGYGMYPPPGAAGSMSAGAPTFTPATRQGAATASGQPLKMSTASPGQEYMGSLKSLSAKNGFGFITCKEIMDAHKRDVYVDAGLLPDGVKIGDRFRFAVEFNDKGHPRAHKLVTDMTSG